jgi:hypothetical protein
MGALRGASPRTLSAPPRGFISIHTCTCGSAHLQRRQSEQRVCGPEQRVRGSEQRDRAADRRAWAGSSVRSVPRAHMPLMVHAARARDTPPHTHRGGPHVLPLGMLRARTLHSVTNKCARHAVADGVPRRSTHAHAHTRTLVRVRRRLRTAGARRAHAPFRCVSSVEPRVGSSQCVASPPWPRPRAPHRSRRPPRRHRSRSHARA